MIRQRRSALLALVVAVVALAGCELRLATPPGEGLVRYRDQVFSDVAITKDIAYGQAPDLTGTQKVLTLDLYEPAGDTVTRRPAIVWVHGGGFRTGSKTSGEIVEQARHFARLGYVNVSINYRLSSKGCLPYNAECPAAITMAKNDAQAAVRFLRAKASTYDIDTSRIAIAGTSAGAITAYNVAYGSDSVGSSGNPGPSSKVRAAVSLSGAAILTSPDPGEPPTLAFHTTGDAVVPYSWNERTVRDAKAAGLRAEATVWPSDVHVPYAANRTQILTETRNFLFHTLDLGRAAR